MEPLRKAVGVALLALLCMGVGVYCARAAFAPARAQNPLAVLSRSAADDGPIRGRVEQRLAAGSYSYLALRTQNDALLWAVTMGQGAPVGAHVVVRSMGHKTDFHSRRLQRTFPELVFGIVSQSD